MQTIEQNTGMTQVFIHQVHEIYEWLGFETRNKYEIFSGDGSKLGYAAEQQKGLLGYLFRNTLGHWRSFEIYIFNPARELVLIAKHPFRFFFQRLELYSAQRELLGVIQQRFSILSKRFDVIVGGGVLEVNSPLWSPWTFPFFRQGIEIGRVKKRWSGAISEIFTDRDNFIVEFENDSLSEDEKNLMIAAALFIDLQYFERKAK